MSEITTTIEQISTLIDTLCVQCASLNKDDNKDEIVNIKQQLRKLESKLSSILTETKVPIGLSDGNKMDNKLDKLKARAARFGCENDEIKKVTESEKLNKRKERFNIDSTGTSTSDEAKKRRLERFGAK